MKTRTALLLTLLAASASAQQTLMRTQKPPLHGSHWMAVTGKPLGATAGAIIFQKGGNAVDATAAMIAADCTMWDTLSWGGETQALIYNPHAKHPGPYAGEMFRQPDLAATLRKLVDTEQQALKKGKSRKEAIYAAYDRFYKGDIAKEIVRGAREQGGLFTEEDLANWKVHIEEPVSTNYKGVDVYKLNVWTQGPAMLQALNILENFDLKSMGYNSPHYINTVYQAMSLAWADRDFYYGDIYVDPPKPVP